MTFLQNYLNKWFNYVVEFCFKMFTLPYLYVNVLVLYLKTIRCSMYHFVYEQRI